MRSRVLPVVRKELAEIRRDRITLGVAFGLPVLMLFLFGYAVSLDVRDVPLAVLDLDRSHESAELVAALLQTGDYTLRHHPRDEREVRRLLDSGEVRLAVVVPPGFARELRSARTARFQTLVDGVYSAHAGVLRDETDALAIAFSRELRERATGLRPPEGVSPQPRVWFNASLRSSTFVVPGLFAVILMAFPPLLTALAVVRERESGSIQQIFVSPLRPWEFIAGKMIPYVLIAFAELAVVLALGAWWFHLPIRGSFPLLLLASALYVLCTVGIGILVSTLTRSQVVAVILALLVTVMPSMLFSGFMWPIETMPPILQWYTRIFPARYYNEVSRGIFLKGTGWRELGGDVLVLAGYLIVVFTAASLRFRKKVA